MKTYPQATEEMQHVANLLEAHRVAMFTLVDEVHGLSSRPMTPLEMDGSGAIWIMTSRKSMQTQLGNTPRPAGLVFMRHHDGDYIAVKGTAALVDDAQRKRDLWTVFGRPWFEGPEDPDLVLVKISPSRFDIWDGPDNAISRVIGMAASIVAGREVGLGHKEVVEPSKVASKVGAE